VGARYSAPVQPGLGTHPVSYTVGTGSFQGVKRPGRGVDNPLPTNAEVIERVELYLYVPLWAFMVCYRVTFTFKFIYRNKIHGVNNKRELCQDNMLKLWKGAFVGVMRDFGLVVRTT
jgi:hypothetical protein